MPTKEKNPKDKSEKSKKVSSEKIPTKKSSEFILHIAKCGTDTLSQGYKLFKHNNPVLLGLQGVNMISNGLVKKKMDPAYKYMLACSILKGLDFKKENLLDDIENIADRIRVLSLNNGGAK